MELLIQTFTNMLILAAIYILVGLGFAFLFNMLGVFNVAHGSIYMVSGYLGYLFIGVLGINPWIGFLSVVIVIAALGVFLERFCFRPFIGDFNSQVMIGVALIVIMTTSINISVGSQTFVIPSLVKGVIKAGPYSITGDRIFACAVGAVVLVLIFLFVNRTRWGQQMQAITQNMEGAILQGISIHRISAMASALGCALAAIAGVVMGSMFTLSPFMGDSILVKILILVIIAGAGSLGGIFIAGLIMGMLYAGLPMLLPGAGSDAVAVIIVCIILLIRPHGFFGHEA